MHGAIPRTRLYLYGGYMDNKRLIPVKREEYNRLLADKATIMAAKEAGVYPNIIDKMLSLYRSEVEKYKQTYSE